MYTYGDFLRNLIARPLVFNNSLENMKNDDFIKDVVNKVRGAIILNSNGLDETKDFGGDISNGGYTFDEIKLKAYISSILDDATSYLRSPSGKINYSMDNILIGYNILRNRGRFEDSVKVLYIGLLYNSYYIADIINRIRKTKSKPTKIGFYIGSYSAKKYDYHHKYMMYLTIPKGFKCYLFEPENIVHIVLLSRLGGMNSAQIKNYLSVNKGGILISEIDMQTEMLAYDTILRNKIYKLNGYYGKKFKEENRKAVVDNGENINSSSDIYYTRVLMQDFLALMDKVFYINYNKDLVNKPEITEKECFINFATPRSASVCIREDLDINYVLPSLAKKMKEVGKFNILDPFNYV